MGLETANETGMIKTGRHFAQRLVLSRIVFEAIGQTNVSVVAVEAMVYLMKTELHVSRLVDD